VYRHGRRCTGQARYIIIIIIIIMMCMRASWSGLFPGIFALFDSSWYPYNFRLRTRWPSYGLYTRSFPVSSAQRRPLPLNARYYIIWYHTYIIGHNNNNNNNNIAHFLCEIERYRPAVLSRRGCPRTQHAHILTCVWKTKKFDLWKIEAYAYRVRGIMAFIIGRLTSNTLFSKRETPQNWRDLQRSTANRFLIE